jgi:hypothetical protein
MKRSLLVALLSTGFAAGCLVTSLTKSMVPPARAGTTPQRWEYFCHYDTSGFNLLGKEGWELAAGATSGTVGTFCFKRPLP